MADRPAPDALRFEALGTTCELFALDAADGRLEETAAWIAEMHQRLTRFEPSSELSRFNASAGRWVEVSPEMQALLVFALAAYAESGGLVHAGVLPALLAAGYDRTFSVVAERDRESAARGALPECTFAAAAAPSRLAAALDPLPDLLDVAGGRARLRPGAAVDLGGLAKGWLADRAVERIGPNALVSLGGDLIARGAGPEGDGWPVGFGDRTLLLRDTAAATSGTARRRWGDGQHHLIDPRTGTPSRSDLTEVSVLAPDAASAEVMAKTALLLGSADAPSYLEATRATGWRLC